MKISISDEYIKNRIIKYLGLENIEELAKILKLEPINIIYNTFHYFELNSIPTEYKSTENLSGLEELENKCGWKCILSNQERNKEKYGRPNWLRKTKHFYPLDCGHILALHLFEYIDSNYKDKLKLQKICNNFKYNLFAQFPRANRNQQKDVGQLRFEQLTWDYISKNPKEKIYYEIELIYYNYQIDSVPIGTRIFVCKNKEKVQKDRLNQKSSKGQPQIPFHVFIPNYDFNSNIWSKYKPDKVGDLSKQNIRDFFKKFPNN